MSYLNLDTFSIGQQVRIKEAEKNATVQAVLFNMDGTQYQIAYWLDGIRRIEWVFSHEIMAIRKPSMVVVSKDGKAT